jgi:hypothetical protein
MAGQGILTFASDALKLVYGDLHEQLADKNPALEFIESSSQHITQNGKEVIFDTHIGRNQGIGARGVREALPVAGAQKYKQAHLYLKNLYGAIEVDGQLFEQAADNYNSFINVVDAEIKGLKRDLSRDLNRQIYGDASGTIAVVKTAVTSAASTVVFVDAHFAEEGMVVDLLDGTDLVDGTPTVKKAALVITAVNETTGAVTFDATTVAAVGDIIVRASGGANSFGKELTGLGAIVGAGNSLHGIDGATVSSWNSTVRTLGSVGTPGTLTEMDLISLVQAVDKKGGDVDVFLASPGVYNAYWNLLQGMRQFTNGAGLTGGQRSFTFEALGKPIKFVSDYAAPKGTIYALSSKELVINRKKDWSWMDRDGSMWSRVANTDAYEARLYQYSEIGTYRRNAHAKLSNIAELGA